MTRLRKFLKKIIDPTIIDDIFIKDQEREEYESKENIDLVLQRCQTRKSPCTNCSQAKHQDLPGFVGKIQYDDYTEIIINKDIIIFGMEISSEKSIKEAYSCPIYPTVLNWSSIHIWYELGYLKEEDLNELFEYAPLWKILDLFIPIKKNLHRFYGTDLAKCFTSRNKNDKKQAYKNCEEFLIEELDLFMEKGLLFVLQGNESRDQMKLYFKLDLDEKFKTFLTKYEDELSKYGGRWPTKDNEYPIEIGTFTPWEGSRLKKKGKYLRIYHSTGRYFDKDNEKSEKFWNRIIRDKEKHPIKELIELVREFHK